MKSIRVMSVLRTIRNSDGESSGARHELTQRAKKIPRRWQGTGRNQEGLGQRRC